MAKRPRISNRTESAENDSVEAQQAASDDEAEQSAKKPRVPKRRVAILMGYRGTGYHGMQINHDTPTIELELHKALIKVGAISPENASSLQRVQFVRSCRTDKGVHAARQLVSLKMMVTPTSVEELNVILPEQIRIWAVTRVCGSFHAKNYCNGRKYEYLMPTYMLRDASDQERKIFTTVVSQEQMNAIRQASNDHHAQSRDKVEKQHSGEESETEDEEDEKAVEEISNQIIPCKSREISPEQMKALSDYRCPEETLTRFRSLLHEYEGNHNFHNFTNRLSPTDRSCFRQIKSVTCSEPFVRNNLEWVSVLVAGQSFMLHQIRKMVGMALMATRMHCDKSLIKATLTKDLSINVPKAPSMGLWLNEPLFDGLNLKNKREALKNNDYAGQDIDFGAHEAIIEEFTEKFIRSKIYEAEEAEIHPFDSWMQSLHAHAPEYAYLQPDGKVPDLFLTPNKANK